MKTLKWGKITDNIVNICNTSKGMDFKSKYNSVDKCTVRK